MGSYSWGWLALVPALGCGSVGGSSDATLSGTATLLGHTDNSGITVTLKEDTKATATTAADGTWSLSAPVGAYTVQYAAPSYENLAQEGVELTGTGGLAPAATLVHYQKWNTPRFFTSGGNAQLTPDQNTAVVTYFEGSIATAVAFALDNSRPPVELGPITSFTLTNDHIVWTNGVTVFARPLDGSKPAYELGHASGIQIICAKAYTAWRVYNPTNGLYSIYYAKTDGTVAARTTPVFTQQDGSHPIANYFCNDSRMMLFTHNTSAYPPTDSQASTPMHRIDFATGTTADVSVGLPTSYIYTYAQSPDGNYVYGYLEKYNSAGPLYDDFRGFVASVSGNNLTDAVSISASGGGVNYSYADYPYSYFGWLPDSSGVLYQTYTGNGVAGDLKIWKAGGTASSSVATVGTFTNVALLGKMIGYQDTSTNYYKVAGPDGTVATIDTSGNGLVGAPTFTTGTSDVYLMWHEATALNSGYVAKALGADVNLAPFTATPVTFGASLPSTCVLTDALSNTTYFQACGDGSIAAFPKSTGTAAATISDADKFTSIAAIQKLDEALFSKSDGTLYGLNAMGTELPIAKKNDPFTLTGTAVGPLFVFPETTNGGYIRVSKLDGSLNDEPLFLGGSSPPFTDPTAKGAWFFSAQLEPGRIEPIYLPATNVPSTTAP